MINDCGCCADVLAEACSGLGGWMADGGEENTNVNNFYCLESGTRRYFSSSFCFSSSSLSRVVAFTCLILLLLKKNFVHGAMESLRVGGAACVLRQGSEDTVHLH